MNLKSLVTASLLLLGTQSAMADTKLNHGTACKPVDSNVAYHIWDSGMQNRSSSTSEFRCPIVKDRYASSYTHTVTAVIKRSRTKDTVCSLKETDRFGTLVSSTSAVVPYGSSSIGFGDYQEIVLKKKLGDKNNALTFSCDLPYLASITKYRWSE